MAPRDNHSWEEFAGYAREAIAQNESSIGDLKEENLNQWNSIRALEQKNAVDNDREKRESNRSTIIWGLIFALAAAVATVIAERFFK